MCPISCRVCRTINIVIKSLDPDVSTRCSYTVGAFGVTSGRRRRLYGTVGAFGVTSGRRRRLYGTVGAFGVTIRKKTVWNCESTWGNIRKKKTVWNCGSIWGNNQEEEDYGTFSHRVDATGSKFNPHPGNQEVSVPTPH